MNTQMHTHRSIWGNGAFATANVRTGNINPDQYAVYLDLAQMDGTDTAADLLVYLDVPPHICAIRCASRGRGSENGINTGVSACVCAYFVTALCSCICVGCMYKFVVRRPESENNAHLCDTCTSVFVCIYACRSR
jgi:hypothetical protein